MVLHNRLPAGTAGPVVLIIHPNLQPQLLCLLNGKLYPVQPVLVHVAQKGNYEVIDLMPSLSFDKVITWEAPKGPWKLFYFIERP